MRTFLKYQISLKKKSLYYALKCHYQVIWTGSTSVDVSISTVNNEQNKIHVNYVTDSTEYRWTSNIIYTLHEDQRGTQDSPTKHMEYRNQLPNTEKEAFGYVTLI